MDVACPGCHRLVTIHSESCGQCHALALTAQGAAFQHFDRLGKPDRPDNLFCLLWEAALDRLLMDDDASADDNELDHASTPQ